MAIRNERGTGPEREPIDIPGTYEQAVRLHETLSFQDQEKIRVLFEDLNKRSKEDVRANFFQAVVKFCEAERAAAEEKARAEYKESKKETSEYRMRDEMGSS